MYLSEKTYFIQSMKNKRKLCTKRHDRDVTSGRLMTKAVSFLIHHFILKNINSTSEFHRFF